MTPYYADEFVTIWHGDCREVLPHIEGCTACVTDPPYGLEFMGKDWDKLDWRDGGGMSKPGIGERKTEWVSYGGETANPSCRECRGRLRGNNLCRCITPDWHVKGEDYDPVARSSARALSMQRWYSDVFAAILPALLPGAPMLAFGGTRTHHRLMCGIEDAGFEIRDALFYMFGAGFPKSHQFGCKCGGNPVPYTHAETTEHNVRPVRGADLSEADDIGEEPGQILLAGLPEPSTPTEGQAGSEPEPPGREQPGMEGRNLHRTGEGIPDGEDARPPESESERVRAGAHPSSGADVGTTASEGRGGPSSGPRQAEQRPVESPRVLVPPRTLGNGAHGGGPCCPRCGGVEAFRGYGTALKPAFEIIVLAMKPLGGTFAQNALAHGVAGLNVDGSRIGTGHNNGRGRDGEASSQRRYTDRGGTNIAVTPGPRGGDPSGRWPANVVLDTDAAALLDEQSGERWSGSGVVRKARRPGAQPFRTDRGWNSHSMTRDGASAPEDYGDSGGASRFFYTAKASRSDRGEDNGHPTVKPSDLMKWLVTLVRMPERNLILDPFAGSGTTGYACKELAIPCVLIEQDEAHCEIAAKRLVQGVLAL